MGHGQQVGMTPETYFALRRKAGTLGNVSSRSGGKPAAGLQMCGLHPPVHTSGDGPRRDGKAAWVSSPHGPSDARRLAEQLSIIINLDRDTSVETKAAI